MATKKITDLTLRADFDETCNLPADDSTQTWRVTGAQMRDFFKAELATKTVQSKTANYTVLDTDSYLRGNSTGGAFTFTLPTADADNAGQEWCFEKTSTDLNAITISDGTLTTTINTIGETLVVYSTGSAMKIKHRHCDTDWVAYTPTITNFGTATNVSFYSRRQGTDLLIQGFFQAGTTVAATASISFGFNGTSGNVTCSSVCPAQTGANYSLVGTLTSNSNITYTSLICASTNTVMNIGLTGTAASGLTPAVGANITNNKECSVQARIPITGWKAA